MCASLAAPDVEKIRVIGIGEGERRVASLLPMLTLGALIKSFGDGDCPPSGPMRQKRGFS
jgi:hypothetical protein